MGKINANTKRIGVVPAVLVAALIGTTVAGCSSLDGSQQGEVESRGFTNVIAASPAGDGVDVYYGDVGVCRVKIMFDYTDDTWTGSASDASQNLVSLNEPTAASIRSDKRFDYCSKQSASQG